MVFHPKSIIYFLKSLLYYYLLYVYVTEFRLLQLL